MYYILAALFLFIAGISLSPRYVLATIAFVRFAGMGVSMREELPYERWLDKKENCEFLLYLIGVVSYVIFIACFMRIDTVIALALLLCAEPYLVLLALRIEQYKEC